MIKVYKSISKNLKTSYQQEELRQKRKRFLGSDFKEENHIKFLGELLGKLNSEVDKGQEIFFDIELKNKIINNSYLKKIVGKNEFIKNFKNFLTTRFKEFFNEKYKAGYYIKIYENGGVLIGPEKRVVNKKRKVFDYIVRRLESNVDDIISNISGKSLNIYQPVSITNEDNHKQKLSEVDVRNNYLNIYNKKNEILNKTLDELVSFIIPNDVNKIGKNNGNKFDIENIEDEEFFVIDDDVDSYDNFDINKNYEEEILTVSGKKILNLNSIFTKILNKNFREFFPDLDINLVSVLEKIIKHREEDLLKDKIIDKIFERLKKEILSANFGQTHIGVSSFLKEINNLGLEIILTTDIGLYGKKDKKLSRGIYKGLPKNNSLKELNKEKYLSIYLNKFIYLIRYKKLLDEKNSFIDTEFSQKLEGDIEFMENLLIKALKNKIEI